MQIGGFVKQSLIDYPGKIAAVVFTQGCNFQCGYCHNPSLVLPELFHQNQSITVNEVLEYLKERKDWLDGVVVTGGEPTIHKDLPEFLKELKNLNYKVKLDTNGSNPYLLERLLVDNLVDYVAMDIKTTLDAAAYTKVTGLSNVNLLLKHIASSVILLQNAPIQVEFRTTILPGVHDELILKSIENIIGENKQLITNEFRPNNVLATYLS